MKALLLAAGLGTRLRPLTDHLPKPLVPVCGRPCIVPWLEWLAALGVVDVAINTHWLPEPLHAALGDGAAYGVRLHWQHEPQLLDGVGTLKSFEWLFGDEPVMCINADTVAEFELAPLLAEHQARGAVLTLVTLAREPGGQPPVGWDDAGRLRLIRDLRGGPPPTQRGLFSGVQIVEPAIWRDYAPAGERYHLVTDLLPRLFAADVPVHCSVACGRWADIGTRGQLDAAHAMLLDAGSPRYLDWLPESAPGVWLAPDAVVRGELVAPCQVAPGAVVASGARLGPRAALAPGAVLAGGQVLRDGVRLPGE